jgi:cell division protein FtsA
VVVYADGFPRRVSVLPFGGKTITDDLCTMLEIDEKEAEELKIKYGHALTSLLGKEAGEVELSLGNGKKETVRKIAEITEARMDEIMDCVCYEIAKVSNPAKLEAGIIITGGAARLRGIENLISLKTGLTVRRGSMDDLLATEKEKYNRYENHLLLALVKNASENCTVKEMPKSELESEPQPEPKPESLPKPKKGFIGTLFGSRNDEEGWN